MFPVLQPLQDLAYYPGSEVPPLIAGELHRDTKETEEVAHQVVGYSLSKLVPNGVDLWPLFKVFHGDQELSVSPDAHLEGTSVVNGESLEGCPEVILVYITPTSGPGISTDGRGFALSAATLYVVSKPQSIVALPELTN